MDEQPFTYEQLLRLDLEGYLAVASALETAAARVQEHADGVQRLQRELRSCWRSSRAYDDIDARLAGLAKRTEDASSALLGMRQALVYVIGEVRQARSGVQDIVAEAGTVDATVTQDGEVRPRTLDGPVPLPVWARVDKMNQTLAAVLSHLQQVDLRAEARIRALP